MKNKLLLTGLLFASLCVQAQSSKSTVKNTAPFRCLEVSDDVEVLLVKGSKESVSIETKGVYASQVGVYVQNNTLHLYNEKHRKQNMDKPSGRISIQLTYVQLDSITAKDGAKVVTLQPVDGESIFIKASENGAVGIKSLHSTNLTLRAINSGQIFIDSAWVERDLSLQNASLGFIKATNYARLKSVEAESSDKGKMEINLKSVDNLILKAYSNGKIELLCDSVSDAHISSYSDSKIDLEMKYCNNLRGSSFEKSKVHLEGKGAFMGYEAYSSSRVNAKDFTVKKGDITAYALGKAEVKVTDTLNVSSYNMGKIIYEGNPYIVEYMHYDPINLPPVMDNPRKGKYENIMPAREVPHKKDPIEHR